MKIEIINGESFTTKTVLLTIGWIRTQCQLNVTGENTEKAAYRLLEAEDIIGKNILLVGGGDSAIESALLLVDKNKVTLSYRSDKFNRLKSKNTEKFNVAIKTGLIDMKFSYNVVSIEQENVHYK